MSRNLKSHSGYNVDALDLHIKQRYDDNSVSRHPILNEGMIFKLRDSESYSHLMHRLSASESVQVTLIRLKIEAVLPSSIRESKTEAHLY